jgi:hypothetical protein
MLLAWLIALVALALQAPGAAGKSQKIYWGAQIGDQMTGEAAPWDMRPVHRFERIAGKGLSLIEFGSPFAECSGGHCTMTKFPTTPLRNVRNYGAIPIFSWNSSGGAAVNQPAFQLSDVIRGRYDDYIRGFARQAKQWGHPFFLRFDWEMNGFWFPWNEGVNGNRPGQFVAAWRHVHDIFKSVRANNVSWVWCPNVEVNGNLRKLAPLYPGGRYVDWTCLDGFNWGRRAGSPGWLSFNQIYKSTYRRIARLAPSKPMILAEMASTDRGGSKANWIRNTYHEIRTRYSKIHGVVWYDVNDRGTGWPIETSHSVSGAFRRAIGNPAYQPNVFKKLSANPIPPPR